ncbi:MAG: SEC-C metal-binding domain-containing protein [Dehalococcoidales bacterium]|nr:SEC-C metal-binding domain-containing protein [Dehalococcoidales bacterium]
MEHKKSIGRNELCSCGSGKKYKNCCYGKTETTEEIKFDKKSFNPFKLNKEIAYLGEFGKNREKFCIDQQEQLKNINDIIYKQQFEEANNSGKTISCHRGCSMCCSQYIPASLQECEAIVHYLYNHERKLSSFIRNYKKWKSSLDEHKGILDDFQSAYSEMWESGFDAEKRRKVEELGAAYAKYKIPCPFLKEDACMIYDIRPLVCSCQVAVTPPEYCDPDNPDSIKQELILMLPENFQFVPFYHESFNEMNLSGICMPYVVYNLLEGGYLYLMALNSKKEFTSEVVKDEQVKKLLDAQLDYYEENDPDFEYEVMESDLEVLEPEAGGKTEE